VKRILSVFLFLGLAACAGSAANPSLERIQTIVVIYAENHSFDNLYGMFPGANGVANAAAEQKTQLDHDGAPLPTLPPVYNGAKVDARYPTKGLPNGPFRIDQPPVDARMDQVVPSPIHNYWQSIEQINWGKNNKFVAMTNVGAWTMGYYDGSSQRVWKWAQRYTLADRFFMGAFGGSFLNHQWLICTCAPEQRDAPVHRRLVDSKRSVGQPGGIFRVGLARRVDGRQRRERLAVEVELRLLLGGRVGHAVGAREQAVHVVEAVVLGVDHHDGLDAIERRLLRRGQRAAGEGERHQERMLAEHQVLPVVIS